MRKKYSPDGIACGKCKWWFGGQCRRHPPVMVSYAPDNQNPTQQFPCEWWPNTKAEDWCGDFVRASP